MKLVLINSPIQKYSKDYKPEYRTNRYTIPSLSKLTVRASTNSILITGKILEMDGFLVVGITNLTKFGCSIF